MKTYQPSFLDEADRLHKLDKLKDPLTELKEYIDFEIFRPKLEEAFSQQRRSNAGRKPYDVVLMFKILILQRLYNLSDEQVEYQIADRLSFGRFLDLPIGRSVPDFTTVWRFREALVERGFVRELFDRFTEVLESKGLITKEGSIVDASFVEVPKQRNSREDNELLKKGETPEEWKAKPAKLCQKDPDARWTKKNGVSYYGYKNHVKCDAVHKVIVDYKATDASVHDSQVFADLVGCGDKGGDVFADSAYKSAVIDELLADCEVGNYIHEKGYRSNPLSDIQKEINRLKSAIRCTVEHIFGHIQNSMGGPELRYIGFNRIEAGIGLGNLAYNMKRYIQILRPSEL